MKNGEAETGESTRNENRQLHLGVGQKCSMEY